MWVLQMQLAKKQAVSFMNVVKELHGENLTVAIGTNQPKSVSYTHLTLPTT